MAYGGRGGDLFSPHLPTHMNPWSKIQLGWVTPTDVDMDKNNEPIDDAENNADVYRLWTGGSPTTEYFLVEYRRKTGFDQRLPGCGLLIYHVDESVKTGDFDNDGTINVFDNALQWDETHKFIDIEAASQTGSDHTIDADVLDDKSQSPHNPTVGSGVLFSGAAGANAFDSNTTPSSVDYTGQSTDVSVTDITSCSTDPTVVTADLSVGTLPSPNENLWVNDCAAERDGRHRVRLPRRRSPARHADGPRRHREAGRSGRRRHGPGLRRGAPGLHAGFG